MLLWDEITGTYINESLEQLTKTFIQGLLGQSATYTQGLLQQTAMSSTTQRTMFLEFKEIIKREYIRQYLAGIGGIGNMTFRDWGSIGGMLKQQYGYLRDFVSDIINGNVSEAQLNARLNMYVNSGSEAYNRAKGRVTLRLGFDQIAWNLGAVHDHCEDCLQRSRMGFVPIGPKGGFMTAHGEVWPGDGNSLCLSNCQCTVTYRSSRTMQEYSL